MKNFLLIKPKLNIKHGGTDFIVFTCKLIIWKEFKESLYDGLEWYISVCLNQLEQWFIPIGANPSQNKIFSLFMKQFSYDWT